MPATEQTWRSQKLLHRIFAVSSLVLLISTIWMLAKDHDRQWKGYQRTFREIEVINSQWDEVRAEAELNEEKLIALKEELLIVKSTPPEREMVDAFIYEVVQGYRQQAVRDQGEAAATSPAVEKKISDVRERINKPYAAMQEISADASLDDAEVLAKRVENRRERDKLLAVMGEILARASFMEKNLLDTRKMKAAEFDAAKSTLDLAVRDNKSTSGPQQAVDKVKAQLNTLTLHYQQASDHRKELLRIIDEINAEERRIDKLIADNRAEMEQITKGIKGRQAHWIEGYWLGKKLLESPILDAFNSPLKIDNLWTEGLTHNYYNFKPVLRYDRCTTCHQAMEKTQAGSAVDPKYEPVHELTFAMATPTQAELAQLLGVTAEGDAEDDESPGVPAAGEVNIGELASISSVYGFMLAAEGILHRDDVTINYVRDESRAAKASLADDEAGVRYLSAELIEASVSAAFDAEGARRPQFGLAVGDVIVAIGGDIVLSNEDVRRTLLKTVQWGQPINIKVRRGYPHPFQSHPRLDLFVGSTSPHKLQDLGCTVCHEGQGSATDFDWASHTPNSLKQRDQWRKEYGWFDNHHWIFPMYPKRFVESSCLQCHHDVTELEPNERFPEPPAPKLMSGYNTVRRYGCFGCHEVVGYDGPDRRVGPDLRLEPNYFAAGLQLAYTSEQRVPELEELLPDLKAKVEARQADAANVQAQVDAAGKVVADVGAEIQELKKAETPDEAAITAADERLELAKAKLEELNDDLKPLAENARLAESELAMVNARIATLREAIERGAKLGDAPYDNENRRRLKELLDNDQDAFNRYNSAKEAGEKIEDALVPAFVPEAYNTAMVLNDDETPGQFRKVGPSLRYVDAKLDQPFLDDWIREPKHFRPSTRMPQFFGQFDHIQAEFKKTKDNDAEWNEETERLRDHTADLEDIEIQGIRTYIQHYSQPFEPVEGGMEGVDKADQPGDAARGKVLFEVGGCLACHSNDDFPGHGDQGPDLTGLGGKLVGEKGRLWLYGWIQNPERYHARTKMPVVTLKPLVGNEETDPIADVVEYLLADKTDWQSEYPENNIDEVRLDELALMHLSKTFSTSIAEEALKSGIEESRRSRLKGAEVELLIADELVASGDQLSQEQKLLYIGSKSIAKYGCYACHDIPGFEGAKPIGTALSDWGRKDPSKLAFEHINHYVGHGAHGHGGHADDHGEALADEQDHADPADEAYYQHQLHHHSRVGFIHQKLNEPRSFDYAKLANKPYNDRLKMPLFPLDHEQHEQIITFVLGLVADPPPEQFIYVPGERQQALNEGRKVLDRFNCGGCHELQREQWDISFPENWESLSNPIPSPTFPFLTPHVTQDQIDASVDVSRSGRLSGTIAGRVKRQSRGALSIYAFDPDAVRFDDAVDSDFELLSNLGEKQYPLRSLAYGFELYEPTLLGGQQYMPKGALPQIPVEMITRRRAPRGGDLARYLMPVVLKHASPDDRGEEAWGWVPPSLVGQGNKTNPDWLHSFLLAPYPIRPAVMLNMPKFNLSPDDASKIVNYFAAQDNAEYPYEFEVRTSEAHLAQAAESYRARIDRLPAAERDFYTGDRFDDAIRMITDREACVKCHSVGDFVSEADPRTKGPNLTRAYQRLRPKYVREWIAYPTYKLPYTTMPDNFAYKPGDPQADGFKFKKDGRDFYHGDGTQQLDALVDVLMNLDKYAESRTSIAELVPPAPAIDEAPADAPAADQPDEGEATNE